MSREAQSVEYDGQKYVVIKGDLAFWQKRKASELKKAFAGLALAIAGAFPVYHGMEQINAVRKGITQDQITASPLYQQFKIECLGKTLTEKAPQLGGQHTPLKDTVGTLEKSAESCADQKTRQNLASRTDEFKNATLFTLGGFAALTFGILFMSAKLEDSRKAKQLVRDLDGPRVV